MAVTAKNVTPAASERGMLIEGLSHYPLSDTEEQKWLEQFNTGFKTRSDALNKGVNAVVRDLNRVSVAAKLNNGTQDGKIKTVSVSLGTLNTNRYDEQKAMNIIDLMKPCLSKAVYVVQETKVSLLSSGE